MYGPMAMIQFHLLFFRQKVVVMPPFPEGLEMTEVPAEATLTQNPLS